MCFNLNEMLKSDNVEKNGKYTVKPTTSAQSDFD